MDHGDLLAAQPRDKTAHGPWGDPARTENGDDVHRASVRGGFLAETPAFPQTDIVRLEIGREVRSDAEREVLGTADRHRGKDEGDLAGGADGVHGRLYEAKSSPEAAGGTMPSLW